MVRPIAEVEEQEKIDLEEIVQMLGRETERWRDQLAVSIGRASELTGLKESQIRYFEELEALQPQKTTEHRGASRLYTIADLRRLSALGRLTRLNYRPAEAARIVRANAAFVDSGVYRSVSEIVTAESMVVTDGFLLSRVLSQVLLACQEELKLQAEAQQSKPPQIRGALVPLRRVPELEASNMSSEELTHLARSLGESVADIFVVLNREEFATSNSSYEWPPPPKVGSDESFVMFYSREAWSIPATDSRRYLRYVSQTPPWQAIVLLLDGEAPAGATSLTSKSSMRAEAVDRLLALAARLGDKFRVTVPPRAYRYRTDGMPISHTHHDFAEVLRLFCEAVFRNDDTATSVLLTPDRLRSPTRLSILAHHNYPTDLIQHAHLDLTREPRGLSGRAFHYRELFLTRDARNDPRIAYAVEERCECAMAIPLTLAWAPDTYGVLYLASKREQSGLSSMDAYLAWVLSTVLTELLARWWTTRIRMANDEYLHREIRDMVEWLDGLGPYGPSFQRALNKLVCRWNELKASPNQSYSTSYLGLVVFDVDNHTSSLQKTETEPLLLRAQRHVRDAIERIVPDAPTFWFKNDHTILLLERPEPDMPLAGEEVRSQETILREIEDQVRRIARQVRMVPLSLDEGMERRVTISVSAAGKVFSLQDFADLHQTEDGIGERFRQILDELRRQAGDSAPGSVIIT